MATGGAPDAPATFFLFSVWLCLVSQLARSLPSPVSSNSNASITDETALLSFKSALYSSGSQLDSWNSSTHFCRWPGVVCGRRHPERVVALRMGSFNLSGPISPSLGNLSFLREVHLDINSLTGEIPPELSRLGRLEFLKLSSNQLHGEIPTSLGTMPNLYILDLEENRHSGEIPVSLASLPSIGFLFLYSNMLTGEIPPEMGNLTGLMHLDLMENMLSGPIPHTLGMLSRLIWLSLAKNTLNGEIPASIWNVSSLWGINIQQNNLTGAIPADAFSKLANLVSVSMDNNRFHGRLPASLANATQLQLLQLGPNSFTGVVPRQIGALTKLQWLLLSNTLVGAEEPADWEFLKAMANCSQLLILDLTAGRFAGVLPANSLSNLSSSLKTLYLPYNMISGTLPEDIGNLVNLQSLVLDSNSFNGALPHGTTAGDRTRSRRRRKPARCRRRKGEMPMERSLRDGRPPELGRRGAATPSAGEPRRRGATTPSVRAPPEPGRGLQWLRPIWKGNEGRDPYEGLGSGRGAGGWRKKMKQWRR